MIEIMSSVAICLGMSPTDYKVNNESLLIGGEVCLWTEFADDDSIMPRIWLVYSTIKTLFSQYLLF